MAKGTLNKVMLIGRLGKDPELRYTAAGVPVATMTLATNEAYKDKDSKLVEQTDWHRLVAWRKTAEICGQYLKKGSLIYVEGKLKTRSYDDKDGTKKYITEISGDNMQIRSSRHEGAETVPPPTDTEYQSTPATGEHPASTDTTANDDLPF
jgi:single-strand DNA-binding protein